MTADAEVLAVTAATLHWVRCCFNAVDEFEVAVVNAFAHGIATLMAIDALCLVMAGFAATGVDTRHLCVHAIPSEVVIGGPQWRKVVVTGRAGRRCRRHSRRGLPMTEVTCGATRVKRLG